MSVLSIIATIIALLIACWAIWFLVGLIRYVRSGDYDIDQRLRNISQ